MILDIDLKIDVFFVSAKRRNGFPSHVRRDITALLTNPRICGRKRGFIVIGKTRGSHIPALMIINNAFVKPFAHNKMLLLLKNL